MTEMTAREFARKTARTTWMVGVGVGAYVGVQTGVIPAAAAQLVYGGVAYDVTKYVTWVVPRGYYTVLKTDCECPDEELDRFGREECLCRKTGARE